MNKNIRDYINLIENAQIGESESVAEGSLNEFAPDGFNGGDDNEGFSPEIAKMAQEDGFTKGASLADGATLERAITINHWHSQHGGMYKQYFLKKSDGSDIKIIPEFSQSSLICLIFHYINRR